jgi:hypothetical protein
MMAEAKNGTANRNAPKLMNQVLYKAHLGTPKNEGTIVFTGARKRYQPQILFQIY